MSSAPSLIRSDWDIVQIATFAPECLSTNQSEEAAVKQRDIDLRASGLTVEGYTNNVNGKHLKEQVVKLVLPAEPIYFSQTGIGPKYLIAQTKPTDAEVYHDIVNQVKYAS